MTPVSLTPWQVPPAYAQLNGQSAHVWRFRIDLSAADIDGLKAMLCHEELLRANRLLDPVKANKFVAARGRLRQILARYLSIPPASVEFAYGEYGKPCLAGSPDDTLMFNLSHAGCWGLLVVASEFNVGVDVEKIDFGLEYEKVATRYFSADEISTLTQLQSVRRRRAFYRIWTLKEARLKGEGSGFSSTQQYNQGTEWLLRSFSVDRDYLGALAVAKHVVHVQRWNFS
jgi:4'-phosphopantetheinyl transferase